MLKPRKHKASKLRTSKYPSQSPTVSVYYRTYLQSFHTQNSSNKQKGKSEKGIFSLNVDCDLVVNK